MKAIAYSLLPSQLMDPSVAVCEVIIVTDGENGYHETDWKWSRHNAEACRDAKNAALGLKPQEAERILVRSMF